MKKSQIALNKSEAKQEIDSTRIKVLSGRDSVQNAQVRKVEIKKISVDRFASKKNS